VRPENERTRPDGATGTGSTIDAGSGIASDVTESGAFVAEVERADVHRQSVSVQRALAGLGLNAPSLPSAATLLAGLNVDTFTDVVSRWAVDLEIRCVAAGIVPSPISAASMAERAGLLCPVRGHADSVLAALADRAPAAVHGPWLKAEHGGRVARARVGTACTRAVDAVWRGDVAEMVELVETTISELRAAVESLPDAPSMVRLVSA
jgi:hypothetical protein